MRLGRTIMGVLYIVSGVLHFVAMRLYERAVPGYLPAHHTLVVISGIAELAGGLGILYTPTRRAASWGIILLLISVFPANLWMAQQPALFPGIPVWTFWVRLPLQLALIAWAYRYTRPTTATA
jgi:uncharacterized membrane protein